MVRLQKIHLLDCLAGEVCQLTTTHYFEVVVSPPNLGRIFEMDRGGCLRGPLRFFDEEGKKVLELAVGADLPAGCSVR